MGVPGYFKWLIQHCPAIHTKDLQVDCLYVDMNGILHPACHSDGSSTTGTTEQHMLTNFCSKLDDVIFATQPRKLIYFAFDGPAPNAKMVQQRSRRFCSRHNLRVQYKLYTKLATEWRDQGLAAPEMPVAWDSNKITPGTPFMRKVRKAVETYISDRISDDSWSSYHDVAWILSDSSEPGEGEHKLIQFIKKQRAEPGYDPRTTHCLVGMDADLIQLALSIHDPNMMIFRDDAFVSINIVREYFRQCFSSILHGPTVDNKLKNFERLLDDLLLCFCFVGNDFVPALPQLKISSNAIGRCLSVYIAELPHIGDFLTNGGKINQIALNKFMVALSSVLSTVQDPMKDVVDWYEKLEKAHLSEIDEEGFQGGSSECVFSSALKRRMELYVWASSVKTYYNDVVAVGLPGWQDRYYKTNWPDESDGVDIKDRVNREYLRGLQWVQNYYHQECPDWEWYYPYKNGPALDCFLPVKVDSTCLEFTKLGEPLNPLQQLLIVIPRDGASKLLPSSFTSLMYSDLSEYFPGKFEIDFSNCPPKWMVSAILPNIDLSEVRQVTKSCIDTLPYKEKRLLKKIGMRLFVHSRHQILTDYTSIEAQESQFLNLVCGPHGTAGIVHALKTSSNSRNLSNHAVRFQYFCPPTKIEPDYLTNPPDPPLKEIIHEKNSLSPLSTEIRFNWEGMKGLSYPIWGVSIDSHGKLQKPTNSLFAMKAFGMLKKRMRSSND
ncbi:5'-3' exoribonuclease [Perkinsela sp. CCAP 1560/4]|nr:5'-3' exoribonuclease [Perkinsela sp. CCAP 1560/4]KNH07651.1 5'-3' exoribonuclease [Perkinsela sp. CCAP 1560/4]|eukprot:KNH06170.1 5'-3' exoribonuclease [Perkinsela sp. CCAP 1560/4]